MHRQYWAIRVGPKSTGYILDNRVFDTKEDALICWEQLGECNYHHVIKIKEGAER